MVIVWCLDEETSSSNDDDDDGGGDDAGDVDADRVTKAVHKPRAKPSRQPAQATTARGNVVKIRQAFNSVIEQGLSRLFWWRS